MEVIFMKKKVSLITLVFVCLSALLAILALFGVLKLKGAMTDLLFSFLTLAVAGLLTLNSCTMLERKNKLALVSLGLISGSALLVIIALWTNLSSKGIYLDATLTLCILSVCFNLIISNILKLQNKHLPIQIIFYICFAIVAIFLVAASWGSDILEKGLKIFILFIILSLLGFGVLAILSKKQGSEETLDYIKIAKKEYEELLKAKEELIKLKGN